VFWEVCLMVFKKVDEQCGAAGDVDFSLEGFVLPV
jgi:hypothetical protein